MTEETQVIICGAGPTGAVLSALLSSFQISNVVLEKEEDVTTDPRGIALDEDGIRVLQSIGIYDRIFTEIGSTMSHFHFVSGTQSDLYKKPMLTIDNSTSEGGTGHVGVMLHKQPAMERAIRSVIDRSDYSQLRAGCTVTAVAEDDASVTAEYRTPSGQHKSIKGKFLVGADGKTGFVRKHYLEPKGITMERCEGTSYNETWVATNWKISLPTRETHPDFELWALNYTPLQVFDLFFPREFRFLCNPDRPAVCGRFGLEEDRLWRFEFVVKEGENGIQVAMKDEIFKVIYPYLTHPGHRYGLQQPVKYPQDCIEVLRSRPFHFQARSCNKWSLGRAILVGDAAHVFPPFGGQGIASGFRDAASLAWRLAVLTTHTTSDHTAVLKSWYTERKQQLERSLAATIRNGDFVTEADKTKVFLRDWYLWLVQLWPSWKRELEKGPRAAGLARYEYQAGFPFLPKYQGGILFPQVYTWDLKAKQIRFSDDLIFGAGKRKALQLLLIPDSQAETSALLAGLTEIPSNDYISVEDATVLVQSLTKPFVLGEEKAKQARTIARVADSEEFAADPVLCKNRPKPKYYDPFQIRREMGVAKFVVIRHDRFVYAACRTHEELAAIIKKVPGTLLSQS